MGDSSKNGTEPFCPIEYTTHLVIIGLSLPFQVREVFSNYTSRMESIAHIMQPDLQRLMDKESQVGDHP